MRPEDAAAREVPVPQAAAAAVERGVDAAAHRVVDEVGFARARRLPVEGEAEDQHDEAGGGRQRDGQRGVGAPGRRAPRARRCTTAIWPCAEASQCTVAKAGVPSASAISSTPARGAEGVQRLRWPEDVEQRAGRPVPVAGAVAIVAAPSWCRSRRAAAATILPSALVTTTAGPARAPRSGSAARARSACAGRRRPTSGRAGRRGMSRAGLDAAHDFGDRLAAMIEHLHEGADADGDQECDDQGRHRAPQRRLGRQADADTPAWRSIAPSP